MVNRILYQISLSSSSGVVVRLMETLAHKVGAVVDRQMRRQLKWLKVGVYLLGEVVGRLSNK